MRVGWLLALGIVGCANHDTGLVITIDRGDTDADAVELFIGYGCPFDAPCATSVLTATAACAAPGTGWSRSITVDTNLFEANSALIDPGSHQATFQLSRRADTVLPVVAAVGARAGVSRYVSTEIVHDIQVPTQTASRIKLTLANDQVVLQPGTACGWIGERDGSGRVAWTGFGLPTNPDCLGLATVTSRPPQAYCATQSSGSCVLGLPACDAGAAGAGNSCVAFSRKVCVPDAVCPCTDNRCLDRLAGAATHVECSVPVDPAGTPCGEVSVNLLATAPALSCGTMGLGAPDQPMSNKVTFGAVSAALDSSRTSPPCTATLALRGNVAAGQTSAAGLLGVETDAAELILPIQFTFAPALCPVATPAACQIVPADAADGVWRCAI